MALCIASTSAIAATIFEVNFGQANIRFRKCQFHGWITYEKHQPSLLNRRNSRIIFCKQWVETTEVSNSCTKYERKQKTGKPLKFYERRNLNNRAKRINKLFIEQQLQQYNNINQFKLDL